MLIGQSPEFEPNPNECYIKYRLLFAEVTRCVRKPRQAIDAMLGTSNELLARAASLADKTKFVRVDDLFCDRQYCWAVKENVPLYSDDHHVSSQAARDIAAYAVTSKELGHIFKTSRGETGLSGPQPLRLQ